MIQHEGVKLLNLFQAYIWNFSENVETFKGLLNIYLVLIPDKPETETLKSNYVEHQGNSNNLLYEWCLKT